MKTTTTLKGILTICYLVINNIILHSQNLSQTPVTAETKTITVILIDKETREFIPFANVVVYDLSSTQLTVGTTNMEGLTKFIIPSMNAYILKGVYIGYEASIDTLYCNKAGCIRVDTLALETSRRGCFQLCCGCVFFSDVEPHLDSRS